jgi:cytochrome c553
MRRLPTPPIGPTALGVLLLVLSASSARGEESVATSFERSVWPIVANQCATCHGADEPQGGLDLRSVAAIVRGGDSGSAVVAGDADASLLWQRIASNEMPPGDGRKLNAAERDLIRAWITAGIPAEYPSLIPPPPPPVSEADRQHWAFRPLGRPAVPDVSEAHASTPIDAFLLARLTSRGLTYSPQADPTTLVRRAYLDVIGLPPSPDVVDACLADTAPGAYERLIDRLLASPHFGERWGRHWLDVAGYADTVGFDVDATLVITSEGKWLYRDYVIDAFNRDKPFDRFVTEQIAGDELHDWRHADPLTPEAREALIATGFLRTARDLTHEDVGVIPQNFFGIVHDTLEIVGTGLLGLTVNCARCHSHKFDPIPQEDYYRLAALLTPAYNPRDWRPVLPIDAKVGDRTVPDVSPAEVARIEAHNRAIDERVAALNEQLAAIRRPHEERLRAERLAGVPEPIRADTQTALSTAADQRNEVQKHLAEKFTGLLSIKPEEVAAALTESERGTVADLESRVATANAGRRSWGKIQALVDLGPPPATYLLIRGDHLTPGPEVAPGFLRVLSRSEGDALASTSPPTEGTSGRRLALARWLTAPDTPASALLARVMVNRLWGQLFGRGIVSTPENFGAQGERPTHPELLDWLSGQFIDGGWRVKPLLRAMLVSDAYRQASRREAPSTGEVDPGAVDPGAIDPGNELLWRMRLRRLESEIVRDSLLTVSGRLNPAAGGPPILIEAQPDGAVIVARSKLARPEDEFRRSVYLLGRRAYNLSLLTVFDQPQPATNCLSRDVSAVPLQSLTMLNDEFFRQQAGWLADRVTAASGPSATQRIELAFRYALARRPNPDETTWCGELLADQARLFQQAGQDEAAASRQALVELCHTLLNTSEFLYAE